MHSPLSFRAVASGLLVMVCVCIAGGCKRKKPSEVEPPTAIVSTVSATSDKASERDEKQELPEIKAPPKPAEVKHVKAIPDPPKELLPADKATEDQIAEIFAEFKVPNIHATDGQGAYDQSLFTKALAKKYAADVPVPYILGKSEKYPLRIATLGTFDIVRNTWNAAEKKSKAPILLTRIGGTSGSAQARKSVKDAQSVAANAVARLELKIDELEKHSAAKGLEPKRWQAHFMYAQALCRSRLAYLNEYDLLLGYVLKDELPAPEAGVVGAGWRLVPVETMKSKKDIKAEAERARELFAALIAEHPNTPWAAQAARDKAVPLGLKWEVIPAPK